MSVVYCSIGVDGIYQPHIAYYKDYPDNDLVHATKPTGGSWTFTNVDTTDTVGRYPSLAVDANDKLHISYYNDTDAALKYATDASGSWVTSDRAEEGNVGVNTSLAVDSNDKAHIIYSDEIDFNLHYATNASGSWTILPDILSAPVYDRPSIAIDNSDFGHAACVDEDLHLHYLNNTTGVFVDSVVYAPLYGLEHASMAVDANGKAHIAYLIRDELEALHVGLLDQCLGRLVS